MTCQTVFCFSTSSQEGTNGISSLPVKMGNETSKNKNQEIKNEEKSINNDVDVSDSEVNNNNNVFAFEHSLSSNSIHVPNDDNVIEIKNEEKKTDSDLDIQDLDESFDEKLT